MAQFELNILGCGSATSTLRHLPSSQVLNIRDNLYMIDCGEGTQLQMRKMQLKFSRLNHIFISHLHGDHCFGLPGLISTMELLGKTGVLTIHIFKDGVTQFKQFMDYFCRDMNLKIEWHIIYMKDEIIYEDDAITVRTIPLKHRIPSVGFLFAEKPKLRHINSEMTTFHKVPHYMMNPLRMGEDFTNEEGVIIPNNILTTPALPSISYAYCSDTMPAQKILKSIHGVDWLYHEATFGDDAKLRAKQTFHSTARQAGEVAQKANVKKLILGHYSSRYDDTNVLLLQAKESFPNTMLSNEELKIDLTQI